MLQNPLIEEDGRSNVVNFPLSARTGRTFISDIMPEEAAPLEIEIKNQKDATNYDEAISIFRDFFDGQTKLSSIRDYDKYANNDLYIKDLRKILSVSDNKYATFDYRKYELDRELYNSFSELLIAKGRELKKEQSEKQDAINLTIEAEPFGKILAIGSSITLAASFASGISFIHPLVGVPLVIAGTFFILMARARKWGWNI